MNMSYCRYRNTLLALQDCKDDMEDGAGSDGDLSEEEHKAKIKLIALCIEIQELVEGKLSCE